MTRHPPTSPRRWPWGTRDQRTRDDLWAEVDYLADFIRTRLDVALAALGQRDAWIYADPERAAQFETWRAVRVRLDADERKPR